MKTGMNLASLNAEVQRQAGARVDYLVNTQAALRLVQAANFSKGIALVSLDTKIPDAVLNRWALTDNAHAQIAAWCEIPVKFYDRFVADHPDMVCDIVNKLFEREPGTRMVRTLDGQVRAFMSDRYRRLDNDQILAQTLPVLLSDTNADGTKANIVLASQLSENHMRLSVLFTDPSLKQTIGTTHDGKSDEIYPGFRVENSETGRGRLTFRGFFYRSYCTNGAVYTFGDSEFEFTRNHVGGKLAAGLDSIIFRDETKRADDEALIMQVQDMMGAMRNKAVCDKLGDSLRNAKSSIPIEHVNPAISVIAKQVGLKESEKDQVLKNLIAEADLSRYGMMNAITAIANDASTDDERAVELQEMGGKVLNLSAASWALIARAEKVAA